MTEQAVCALFMSRRCRGCQPIAAPSALGVDKYKPGGASEFSPAAAAVSVRFFSFTPVPLSRIDFVNTSIQIMSSGVILSRTSGLTTTEAGGEASFQVPLGKQPTADVTVGLFSSDPNERTVARASLTFTPDDWSTPKIITITGQNDDVADGNVACTIVTEPAVSDDPEYSGQNTSDPLAILGTMGHRCVVVPFAPSHPPLH